MIVVVPVLYTKSEYSFPVKLLLLVVPSWLAYGVLGHVYYMRKRNSYALKLLPQIVDASILTTGAFRSRLENPSQDQAGEFANNGRYLTCM